MTTATKNARGLLFCLEGIDRAGKTTQAKRLVQYLREKDQKVEYVVFPDRSDDLVTGKLLRTFLNQNLESKTTLDYLLFIANRWERAGEILTWLNNGTHVVVDRYILSGMAYSYNLQPSWCSRANFHLPRPDIIFYIRCDPEVAAKRTEFGKERFETLELQQKISKRYDELVGFYQCKIHSEGLLEKLVTIDSTIQTLDQVTAKINSMFDPLAEFEKTVQEYCIEF